MGRGKIERLSKGVYRVRADQYQIMRMEESTDIRLPFDHHENTFSAQKPRQRQFQIKSGGGRKVLSQYRQAIRTRDGRDLGSLMQSAKERDSHNTLMKAYNLR